MSGLTFLFSAALWALPLAALPVLVHLWSRRRRQVVPFPTLRFVRAAVQQTGARRKVHRWLLLLTRAIALAALIWAVAQPAHRPAVATAAGASASAPSAAAVVVVDTSYSMQLRQDGVTLAGRADQAVRTLLDGKLAGMKVAIVRSTPPTAGEPGEDELRAQESFRNAADVRWAAPAPQPSDTPLLDRVRRATQMLAEQSVDEHWLVVISDFQSREFPAALPESPSVRLLLVDLHPTPVSSAGVTSVGLATEPPTAGLPAEAVVDLLGPPSQTRQVTVAMRSLDREGRRSLPPSPVQFDGNGTARLRTPLAIPAGGFFAVEASLTTEEPLAWARDRLTLFQVPPRRRVALLDDAAWPDVRRRVGLALDPTDGQAADWPLEVKTAADLPSDTEVAVAVVHAWPSEAEARRWHDLAARGITVVLFLRPGLEATWAALPQVQRDALARILPGTPRADLALASSYLATVASPADAALRGLTDDRFQIGAITAERLLPFDGLADGVATVLGVAEAGAGGSGTRPAGLLFRRTIGTGQSAGTVFTFATLPDKQFSTLHLHPTFPPMLVQMALRQSPTGDAQNVELGSPLVLDDVKFAALRLETPAGQTVPLTPAATATPANPTVYRYDRAGVVGVYTWRDPKNDRVVAMSNVQYPAAEADLTYTPPARLLTDSSPATVVSSVEQMTAALNLASRPTPRWGLPLAIVMGLLCVEMLVATASGGKGRPS